jgi:hypothetical protein
MVWSSFVTAPLGILANYAQPVEVPWITPNRITHFILAAVVVSIGILIGAPYVSLQRHFIHLSHILDCMDDKCGIAAYPHPKAATMIA